MERAACAVAACNQHAVRTSGHHAAPRRRAAACNGASSTRRCRAGTMVPVGTGRGQRPVAALRRVAAGRTAPPAARPSRRRRRSKAGGCRPVPCCPLPVRACARASACVRWHVASIYMGMLHLHIWACCIVHAPPVSVGSTTSVTGGVGWRCTLPPFLHPPSLLLLAASAAVPPSCPPSPRPTAVHRSTHAAQGGVVMGFPDPALPHLHRDLLNMAAAVRYPDLLFTTAGSAHGQRRLRRLGSDGARRKVQ
jgi:hypothetical protein